MKIRFVKDWRNYVKDAVFEVAIDGFHPGMAHELIHRGFCEELKEEARPEQPKGKKK